MLFLLFVEHCVCRAIGEGTAQGKFPKVEIWLGGSGGIVECAGGFGAAFSSARSDARRGRGDISGSGRFLRREWGKKPEEIKGITFRRTQEESDGADAEIIECTDRAPMADLNDIPFVYEELDAFENKIIYYESGRGCPFSCSYCLSSVDKCLRFRDLELVKRELQFFIDHRVPQVKFVDRTFNCRRSMRWKSGSIWRNMTEG